MDKMELKEMLMQSARAKGICIDGFREMRTDSIGKLVDYYVANPDWCMERVFPSLEILRSEFSDCEDKGVFVGRTFNGEVLCEKQVYITTAKGKYVWVGMLIMPLFPCYILPMAAT